MVASTFTRLATYPRLSCEELGTNTAKVLFTWSHFKNTSYRIARRARSALGTFAHFAQRVAQGSSWTNCRDTVYALWACRKFDGKALRTKGLVLFHKLIICLGDFNAVVGPFGSGSPNDNSDRFLEFCASARLRVCGSWFRRKDIHRLTWHSNDGLTAKEVDHILVNGWWRAVCNCRVYRNMEFDTDHSQVVAPFAIFFKGTVVKTRPFPRFNIRFLRDNVTAATNAAELENSFCDAMTKMTDKVFCCAVPMRHEKISTAARRLIETKRQARLSGMKEVACSLHGCEAWSTTGAHLKRLDATNHWCLRRIRCPTYRDRVTNVEVRRRTEQPSVSSLLFKRRLNLFGHIARASHGGSLPGFKNCHRLDRVAVQDSHRSAQ
ncbi:hypothetical protein HELRODRAFT_162954 [Helobdella robusta]|uniref:Endonuclease/exonuclease/phosphatase domain-containing protein n=1 Tax=Helobdella robusta TaxID=6412 RepID=T1ETF0_HELRO|nr:hypothetical protein HELRODRAFT_162954 [Helobdella robusta]ESN99406.1 hypothetical protein HELRODRAFT_162954 [Helobdella robusta]